MKKVLVVEDDFKFQRTLQVRLGKYKDEFEVILANNGEEAIAVIEQREISLVVTDIQMPKVDGLELLAYINENHPNIPCIVITVHAIPEIGEKLLKYALSFLKKPFRMDKLAEAIREGLNPAAPAPDGSIKGISVPGFIQVIQMEQKTCLLEIAPDNDEKGFLYFKEGKLYDASYGNLKGEEASLKIIAMDAPGISFGNLPDKNIKRRINTGPMGLIMEAMRLKDESEE